MWCTNCHQDVPAIGERGTNRSVCARCQNVLRAPQAMRICDDGIALDEEPCLVGTGSRPPLAANDWQFRQRSRELGRKLRHEVGSTQRRVDPPENLFDELRDRTAAPIVAPAGSVATRRKPVERRPEGGQFVAWLFACCGAVLLGGGIGTIGWSLYGNRSEIWNLALGLTLAGQGLLIFGLVLVVTRLWRNSRYATGRLHEVHTDLAQLQRTADALAAMRAGGAPAFYAELVRGASPQMLLANLKGQLDQLATRLGSDA